MFSGVGGGDDLVDGYTQIFVDGSLCRRTPTDSHGGRSPHWSSSNCCPFYEGAVAALKFEMWEDRARHAGGADDLFAGCSYYATVLGTHYCEWNDGWLKVAIE